jgi:hypothetical protein
VGSALLLAESKFRRIRGYKEIPRLWAALADHGMKTMKQVVASKVKTA